MKLLSLMTAMIFLLPMANVFAMARSNPYVTEPSADGVVLIGDSHTGGMFGKKLDELLRTRFKHVASHSFGGSIPDWFIEGHSSPWGSWIRGWDGKNIWQGPAAVPKMEDLLCEYQPQVVVVALGTNFLRTGSPKLSSIALAKIIASQNAKCIWVGPPSEGAQYQARIGQFDAELSKALESTDCRYISSLPFTRYPEGLGDGIHYDEAGEIGIQKAENWAKKVFQAID